MSRKSNEKHRKKQKKKAKERSARSTREGSLVGDAKALISETKRAEVRVYELRRLGKISEQETLEQGLSQDIEIIEGLARRLESERQEGLAKALTTLGIQKQNAPTK